MTDGLVKQLKDAGFPKECFKEYDPDSMGMDEREPTLSELIEACEGFTTLGHYMSAEKDYWWASAVKNRIFDEEAKSPEEAVAKLWLALNKPS